LVLAKVTDTPDIGVPTPFATVMRIGTVLCPSATMAVTPFVVVKARLRVAAGLMAGACASPEPELLQPFWRASRLKHRKRETTLTT
jgi:hypothetical protein